MMMNLNSLDTCLNGSLDQCSIANLIQGQPKKKKKASHLHPIAFVQLNTWNGKPKPTTVKVLLNSGAAVSLLVDTKKFVTKLRKKKKASQSWNTPGGTLKITEVVKAKHLNCKMTSSLNLISMSLMTWG